MPTPTTAITPGQAATFAKGLKDPDSFPRQLTRMAVLLVAWPLILVWKAPILIAALAAATAAVYTVSAAVTDWAMLAAAAVAPVVLLALWRTLHARSFAPVGAWLLGAVRCGFVYRPRWRRCTAACGLAVKNADGDLLVPHLVRVISRPGRDELRVRMLPGQTPDVYLARVVHLAHSFRVGHSHPEYIDRVSARCDKSGTVTLTFPRADPLLREVPRYAPVPVTGLDLEALPVARLDDASVYRMPLLYTHVLVAGATGAGKGSVLWSLLNAIAPGIPSGLVQPWGIDPKGGMELTIGRSLFHRLAYDTGTGDLAQDQAAQMVQVVDDLAELVRARTARLAGKTRKHVPTPDEPFIVLVIDEMAFLTSYMPYPDLKKRLAGALSTVLTKGRAVAVTVVGLLQDPRKETIPQRNLFPVKIGLRLDSPEESRMVLGQSGWDRGGHCETIPAALPGTGYVLIDGEPTPRRVRFSHITDTDIAHLVWTYPAPPPPPSSSLALVGQDVPALDGAAA